MKATVIFYVLIIWLNVFHMDLCDFTCDHMLNNTVYHAGRGSFVDLNFTIPHSCYPSNDSLLAFMEVNNLTPGRNKLHCQMIHNANGKCSPPSKPQNCTCSSSGLYSIRIWVQGDQPETYRVKVTFGGDRSAHDDVTVDIDERFKKLKSGKESVAQSDHKSEGKTTGFKKPISGKGSVAQSDHKSEGKTTDAENEIMDAAMNSTSPNDHEHGDNSTLTVVIVIVVIVVVKAAFITCVIVGRRLRQRDNNATDNKGADREGHQQFRRANMRDRCPPRDDDYVDYDPLDATYESMKVDRYSHAFQGRVTQARKEEEDGPYDDINEDHVYSA